MCLEIKAGPFTAENDTPLYKAVRINNRAPFIGSFKYEPYKEYSLHEIYSKPFISPERWASSSIDEGFHGFLIEQLIKAKLEKNEFGSFVKIGGTFWYLNYKGGHPDDNIKFVKFIIPKGAKFFVGHARDIVTNRIRTLSLSPVRLRDIKRRGY